MPLTLVLGPANSAKAGEVLGAYGAAARRGALLVVPTAADAAFYARELAGTGAVLGGSVVTFSGLGREIAQRAGYSSRRLSPLQRERVLRRAVEAAQLQTLARSASAPGFAIAAGALISELERALVTPQRFTQALRAWAAQDGRRSAYAEDLAALYGAYFSELERLRRVDADLFAWRALDALRAAPGRWGADAVFFYGFDDLTNLERDAIETLARLAGADVTVSLTYEPGREALTARAEAVEELRPLAAEVRELPAVNEHYEPHARAALHHLERSLFEPGAERLDPGRAVRLLEAGGERAEAELVAAEVLALLRAGTPAEEIVVVHRAPSHAAPLLGQVFAEYGIELAGEHRVPFAHTALGRGVAALARCAFDGGRAEDLLVYLRTPGVLERPELADALEAKVRREGLRTADQARERLGWTLNEIESLRDAGDPAAELARHARRLQAAPGRGLAPALDAAAELDARALAALLRALSELGDLGEPVTGAELLDLLDTLDVRAGRAGSTGAVLLAAPRAIRAPRVRAVLVCARQEGALPLPGRPDPFLSDELRFELAAASGLRLRPGEDALARERYLFYACVSRATEQVVLSYSSSDEEGNLALPSPFIADVAELLDEEWSERRRRRLLADIVWPAGAAPTAHEHARACAARAAPVAGDVEPPVRVLGPVALAHVRHHEIVSPGALESYASCPVKWLVERELQPERFEPESEPLARGTYMHTALEQVLDRLGGPVTEARLDDANRILDEVLTELPSELVPGRPPAVQAAIRRGIEADLRRYLAHEAADGAGWEPRALELHFGFDADSMAPLELADGVRVRGVIDRVDVDPSGRRAIVRDYKSGASRSEHQGSHWGGERQLQVALYMLAVRELLGLEPAAGLYQPLGGEDMRGRGLYLKGAPVGSRPFTADARGPEELDAELADAAERARLVALALRAGGLEPCPHTCTRNGCAYPGICRSQ